MGLYVPLRLVLLVLGFMASAVDSMLRYGISVAIVAMTNTTTTLNHNTTSPAACPAALNASLNIQHTQGGGEYDWSVQWQGIILGTFAWGNLITTVVGGRIAEVVGGRMTVGVTLGLCGVMSLLCPLAASWHPLALAAAQLLTGLLMGPTIPALYSITSRWARPQERATMLLIISGGHGVGDMIGLGLSGLVVEKLGWKWVFYGDGILALAWVFFWFLLVRDSPDQHPLISAKERQLLAEIKVQPRRRVPWSRLFRCRTIYILILVQFSGNWMLTFTSNQAPTFLIKQIGMSLSTSDTLMAVSHGMTVLFGVVFGWLSDFLYRKELLSKLGIRRLMYGGGGMVIVGSCVGTVLAGCNAAWVFALFVVLVSFFSTHYVACLMTPMDIAPNYVGTITGINGLGTLGAFLAPIVNARLIPLNNGWGAVILLNTLVYITTGALYVFWVTADEQDWNLYGEVASSH